MWNPCEIMNLLFGKTNAWNDCRIVQDDTQYGKMLTSGMQILKMVKFVAVSFFFFSKLTKEAFITGQLKKDLFVKISC